MNKQVLWSILKLIIAIILIYAGFKLDIWYTKKKVKAVIEEIETNK